MATVARSPQLQPVFATVGADVEHAVDSQNREHVAQVCIERVEPRIAAQVETVPLERPLEQGLGTRFQGGYDAHRDKRPDSELVITGREARLRSGDRRLSGTTPAHKARRQGTFEQLEPDLRLKA